MKILIVAQTPTHPTTDGNQKLIVEYAELLMSMGHVVHFLRVVDNISFMGRMPKDADISSFKTKSFWGENYREYRLTKVEHLKNSICSQIKKLLHYKYRKCDDGFPKGLIRFTKTLQMEEQYDALIVNYIWLSKLLTDSDIERKAIFTHDYFTYKDLLTGRNEKYACLPTEEAKALQRAPYIFAMQDEEAVFFRMLSPQSRVLINYASFIFTKQSITRNHSLLFLSGANPYNVEGIEWFIKDIFPAIKLVFPDTRLVIGGSVCKQIQAHKYVPGIELKGWVEAPEQFYAMGDVVINPTFHGTGLKIKTFEGIAFGKAVLVHPHSTIGIYKKEQAPLFSSIVASEWVDYLKIIWNNEGELESIRNRCEDYILSMNNYIVNQYSLFLESKINK